MKYFVVFVAIFAFQFVCSAAPESGLLDGVGGLLGGVVGGVVDLIGNVLQLLVSLLRGLLTNGESNSVDSAAAATTKEFDNIIKAARATDCPVTRYDLDDAIKAVRDIAVKLIKILASINDRTLASYSDKIAADLKAGLKSLNEKVRVFVQLAIEKVRPRCVEDDIDNVINSVIKAAGKVANAVQVQLLLLSLYDVHKRNLTEDVSNVILDNDDVNYRYETIKGHIWSTSDHGNILEAKSVAFGVSNGIFGWLTELKITNDQKLTQQTLEAAILATIAATRAFISKVSALRPNVSADENTFLDRIVDLLVAVSAAVINTIQTYLNPIAVYDIYQDASLFPKLYKKVYILMDEEMIWVDAVVSCGYIREIATIEYADENTELVNEIAKSELTPPFWLSATDVKTGNWIWSRTGKSLTFTNWRPTEPNAPGSCMAVGLDNKWYDEDCLVSQKFVCQDFAVI